MIINKIIVDGLFSYKTRQELDLSSFHSVLVTGQFDGDNRKSCGSGKSGLFEAIPICFYGRKGSRADTMDELINRECTTAYTEVHFEFEGNNYIKIRQWGKKDKNELLIEVDGRYEVKASKSEADQALIEVIGLDPIGFFSTVFYKQKGPLQFIEGKSTERKTILQELFNLKVYDDAQKFTKQYLDEYSIKLASSKDKKEGYLEVIEEENEIKEELLGYKDKISKAKKRLDSCTDRLATQKDNIEQLKKSSTDHTQILDDIRQKKNQIKEIEKNESYHNREISSTKASTEKQKLNIEKKTLQIKASKDSIANMTKELDELEFDGFDKIDIESLTSKVDELLELKNKATNRKTKHENSICHIEQDLEKLQSHEGMCPILKESCSRIAVDDNNEYVLNAKKEIKSYSEKVEALDDKLDKILTKTGQISKKIDQAKKRNAEIDQYHLLQQKHNTLIKSEHDRIATYEESISESEQIIKDNETRTKELTNYLVDYEQQRNDIQELIKGLESSVDTELMGKIKELEKSVEDTENEQQKLHIYINTCSEQLGVYKNKLAVVEKSKVQLATVEKQYAEDLKRYSAYEKLHKAFGKNGIQKAIMKNAVPMLESMANKLMNVFAPEKEIYIKFDLDPKTKSGKDKSQGGLEIIITEDNQQMNLGLYSGGETTKIAFSILLSLSELLNKRAGKRMETLIIDERISGLDEADLMQFSEIVDIINTRYRKFIVITHIPQLKEIFEQNIVVNYSDENGSEIL